MDAIKTLTSIAAPLPLPNIDTDQIIPKQFLKRIERTGYGEFLFYDWKRIQEGPDTGKPDTSFVLNKPEYKDAKILITEKNFGCGSSREHAAWAIYQYGFRAVIAPSLRRHLLLQRRQKRHPAGQALGRRHRDPAQTLHREPGTQDHHQRGRADSSRMSRASRRTLRWTPSASTAS